MSTFQLRQMAAPVVCLLLCASATARAQTPATFISLGSDPGEVAGGGHDVYFDETTAEFYLNRSSVVGHFDFVTINVIPNDHGAIWTFSFATPRYARFTGETFFTTEEGGWIDIGVGGRSCGARIGRFVVHEIGAALTVAVDFEARCPGATGGAYGRIRVESSWSGSGLGELEVPALSPIAPGTTLPFRVTADGNTPLEFKFLKFSAATTTWTVVQDYSFRPVWTWTPTIGDLGDYSLQVWVRPRGSAQAYEDWRSSLPFTIAAVAPRIISLHANVPSPAAAGTTITWTATATGGTLPLEYEFVRYAPGLARWLTVRGWSADPVWQQHTTPIDQGPNTVIVAIRSRGSAELEATQDAVFDITPPDGSYVLSVLEDGTGLLNAQQTFYPDRLGSLQTTLSDGLHLSALNARPYSYLFADLATADGLVPGPGRYDDAEQGGDPLADVPYLSVATSEDGSCATDQDGQFRILEMATDATGTHVAADLRRRCAGAGRTLHAAVRINSAIPLFNMLSFTSNAAPIVGPGSVVTWTADASSGAGPVEYRFIRFSVAANAWTVVRDWDRDASFTWEVAAADRDTYYLQVWARTVGSLVAYEGWLPDGPFVVAPVPLGMYGFQAKGVRPRVGVPITLEAVAGGGSGVLEYRFLQFSYATGRWSMIRDYAPSNTVEWTPELGESGTHALQVWVRQFGSTAAYEAWQGLPLDVAPARQLIVAGQAGDVVSEGRSVSAPARVSESTNGALIVRAPDDRGEWYVVIGNGGSGWHTGGFGPADDIGGADVATVSVRHSSTLCRSSVGRLTIHEIGLEPDGSLAKVAADFEQRCEGGPPLYGGLRLNSDVGLVNALSVRASAAAPAAGVRLTLTSVGSSATAPVEFRFFVLDQSTSQWTLLREYAQADNVSWTPPAPGTYVVQVWVRRVGSVAAYESYVSGTPMVVR